VFDYSQSRNYPEFAKYYPPATTLETLDDALADYLEWIRENEGD